MSNQNVKVKPARNPKTPSAFQQGMKEGFVVEDQVSGLLVCEQFYQTLSGSNFLAKHRKNEVDVFGRELNPTVGLNHLHARFVQLTGTSKGPSLISTFDLPDLKHIQFQSSSALGELHNMG